MAAAPNELPATKDDDREARLDSAIAVYFEAAESGSAPELTAWIAGHPDLAPELEEFFRACGMLDALIEVAARRDSRDIGPYRIIRVLGRGGMGVVYEVEGPKPSHRYALKRLLLGFDEPGSRELFDREIEAIAQLHHPNIIPLHDVGEFEGIPYFVMPLVAEASVRDLLHELRRRAGAHEEIATDARPRFAPPPLTIGLPDAPEADRLSLDPAFGSDRWKAIARIGVQVARGLAHAHAHGVLHRDVKPSNLLVDRQGFVILTDFGVARSAAHPDLTATDELPGSLRFTAPERFHRWCDSRSDLYSLGLVLYELATLRRAHDAPDRVHLIRQILQDDPPRPRRLDRAIPRDLETIIRKCIEKEPGYRYPSAEALAADLERFLAGEPPLARRVGPLRRGWSWCRRHRAWAATGFVGVVLAVLLVAGAFRMEQLRAERAIAAERESRYRAIRLQLESLRTGMHRDGWPEEGARLVREAVRLHGPDPEIQTLAVGLLQGLDARPDRVFTESGARFLAFDPQGTRLLIGGATDPSDGSKPVPNRLWDGDRSPPVTSPVTAEGPVGFLSDGTPIALRVTPDGSSLELLDLRTASRIRWFDLPGPIPTDRFEEPPLALAMSPDGSRVAAGNTRPDESRAVAVWDESSTAPVHQFIFPARCLALTSDGAFLAGGTEDGEVAVWSLASGEEIARFQGDRTRIHALAFADEPRRLRPGSPRPLGSGRLLAAATAGGNALVWDIAARARLATCRGSSFEVMTVAFSPDPTLLATAGRAATGVRIWDARTGTLLLEIRPDGEFATALAFSLDGSILAVANRGGFGTTGSVRTWRLDDGRGLRTLRGPESRLVKVAVSPDSRLVAALANDWTVAIWEATSGRLLHLIEVPRGFSPDNAALAFSPDGRRFAFSSGREAVLWDLDTGREENAWPLPPGLNDALAFHESGALLSLRTETRDDIEPFGPNRPTEHPRVVRLRNLMGRESLEVIHQVGDLPWTVNEIRATLDGRYFLVHTLDTPDDQRGRLLILEGPTGERLSQLDSPGPFLADPSGRFLAFGSRTTLISLPGLETARFPIGTQAIGPGATLGVTVQQDTTGIHRFGLVDLGRGMSLGWIPTPNYMNAHEGMAFARDGRFAVWGCRDGTATLCMIDPVRKRLEGYAEEGKGIFGVDPGFVDEHRGFVNSLRPLVSISPVLLRFIANGTAFLILGVMILAHELGRELPAVRDALVARRDPRPPPRPDTQRRGATTMRVLRNQLAVLVLVIMGLLGQSNASRGDLIAHYTFDGNVNDISGNGNHGTIFGDVAFVPGESGQAAYFDNPLGGVAATQYVSLPNSDSILGLSNSSFSFAILYRSTDTSQNNGRLMGNSGVLGVPGFNHNYNSGSSPFSRSDINDATGYISSSPESELDPRALTTDGNYHWAITILDRTAGTFSYYVDDNVIVQKNFASLGTVSFASINIGRISGSQSNYGARLTSVDEFRLYSHALTADEVLELVVPEPSSLALAGIAGVIGLGTAVVRRRRPPID